MGSACKTKNFGPEEHVSVYLPEVARGVKTFGLTAARG
jgi:hypothetical protein